MQSLRGRAVVSLAAEELRQSILQSAQAEHAPLGGHPADEPSGEYAKLGIDEHDGANARAVLRGGKGAEGAKLDGGACGVRCGACRLFVARCSHAPLRYQLAPFRKLDRSTHPSPISIAWLTLPPAKAGSLAWLYRTCSWPFESWDWPSFLTFRLRLDPAIPRA
jgi:hypothetical protein